MKKNSNGKPSGQPVKLSIPVRYCINTFSVLLIFGLMVLLRSVGVITNYWNGIIISILLSFYNVK